ncbi:ferric reductase-like transmembrane domain-containing protein [Maribius pontilimi]|uniref:Ferric reductase-like transmembrane domain-containing protein n=2 Tax=Palleronia pontilimi TaxID=1964209 RepID=A0A934IDZ9_9RHOB|nr:ferric reductase-like transmembrane domain-containing protein [Palleronia pontilimi]MBJ3763896.1 ferric reductase-like transmembrane domain-containing protein [Palleronia pontilimi]
MWAALAVAIVGPLAVAATSPLLEWRGPVYISAGFAGIIAMACLLLQPLLAGGALPGLALRQSRIVHRIVGAGLFLAIVWHVGALWITSPPDVVDALLFRSPTPFSAWGVIAMWAAFAAAALAALRKRIRLRPMTWRRLHASLAALCVGGSAVHAVLIDGTMGTVSKWMLCALSVAATIKLIVDLRIWSPRARRDA